MIENTAWKKSDRIIFLASPNNKILINTSWLKKKKTKIVYNIYSRLARSVTKWPLFINWMTSKKAKKCTYLLWSYEIIYKYILSNFYIYRGKMLGDWVYRYKMCGYKNKMLHCDWGSHCDVKLIIAIPCLLLCPHCLNYYYICCMVV